MNESNPRVFQACGEASERIFIAQGISAEFLSLLNILTKLLISQSAHGLFYELEVQYNFNLKYNKNRNIYSCDK